MSEKNEKRIENENFAEDTFKEIGPFGKFQKITMLYMLFLAGLPPMTIYFTVFNLASPNIICEDSILNQPIEKEKICDAWMNFTELNEVTTYKCHYDKTYYGKTLKTDWNLYCDREYLASLTQTLYLVGSVCAIFSGYFGDRFGRKKSIVIYLIIMSVTILVSQILISNFMNISITVKFAIYCVNQVIIGIFGYCLYVTSYLLMQESTTSDYKTLFSNIHLSIYVIGELLVLLPSYIWKDWEINSWILLGVTVIALFIAIVFLDESPRWLMSMRRYDEARKIFKKIATLNNKSENFNEEFFHLIVKETRDDDPISIKNENSNVKEMFKEICLPVKFNLIKLILLAIVWLSLNLLYYGIFF
jgi:MFS family permease